MAKFTTKLFTSLLMIGAISSVNFSALSNSDKKPAEWRLRVPREQLKHRPKAPSHSHTNINSDDCIELIFSNGLVRVIFPSDTQSLNIIIAGENTSQSVSLDVTSPVFQLEVMQGGEYLIEARTEGGAVYRGVLSI